MIKLLLLALLTTTAYSQEETPSTETPAETKPSADELAQKQLETWKETMTYGISDQRMAVVKKIRFDKTTNALTLLEESFTNEANTTIKEEMIYTFMDLNHTNNTKFWTDLFTEETNLTVLQRATFVVEQKSLPVGDALFNVFTNHAQDPKAMRFNAVAVQALGKLKHPAALPIITDMATNTLNHQDLRGSSVVAMGMYQDNSLIPTLQNFLTNSTEPTIIRRYAALAIGRTGDAQAVEILTPIATDENEEQGIRLNSISGLGYLTDASVVPLLEQLTKADNTAVRVEAIKSLGRLKVDSAIPILEYKSEKDPEAIVRREAKTALQEIRPPEEEKTEE